MRPPHRLPAPLCAEPEPPICPASTLPCNHPPTCDLARLCTRLWNAPIETLGNECEPACHFVGFRGEEYHSAVQAFGLPDFIHKVWDIRALSDIAPGDLVVFAKYANQAPSAYSFDDSNQADDPARVERSTAYTGGRGQGDRTTRTTRTMT